MQTKLFIIVLIITMAGLYACQESEPTNTKTQTNNLTTIEKLSGDIAYDSLNPELYYERALLYKQKQQLSNAVADLLKATKLDSLNAAYHFALGECFLLANHPERSKNALNKALKYNPKKTEAWLLLAKIYLYVRNYDAVFYHLNKAAQINADNPKIYFLKGYAEKEKGDTAAAINSYLTATEKDPQYFEAYMQLGVLYMAKNNDLALQNFLNAQRIKPQDIQALYNIAYYHQIHNETEKAIEYYNKIIEIDAHNADANHNMGFIYLFIKNNIHVNAQNIEKIKKQTAQADSIKNHINSAINYFSIAINHHQNNALSYYHRGLAYELLDKNTNALNDYNTAIELYPDFELAKMAKQRLNK